MRGLLWSKSHRECVSSGLMSVKWGHRRTTVVCLGDSYCPPVLFLIKPVVSGFVAATVNTFCSGTEAFKPGVICRSFSWLILIFICFPSNCTLTLFTKHVFICIYWGSALFEVLQVIADKNPYLPGAYIKFIFINLLLHDLILFLKFYGIAIP